MRYNKQQIKAILKDELQNKDFTLLQEMDSKKLSRVYDFYLGYLKCFDEMKEEPINEIEANTLIKKVIVEFFMSILDE